MKKIKCPNCNKEEDEEFFKEKGCFWCRINQEIENDRKFDSEEAIKTGEGSSDYEAICPYCGEYQDCSWEFHNDTDVECCNCGKEFHLIKEISVTYKTYKLEEEQ